MQPMPGLEAWHDLFMLIGSSAAVLVGLLFVVISLHFNEVEQRADVNMRATIEGSRNNSLHLLTVLVEAAVVLTPQPVLFLGAELVLFNLFGLRLPITIIRRYARQNITISERGGFPTRLIATIIAAYLIGAAGGAGVAMRQDWGLYLVAGSCMVKLVRSVLTAWMLMFGVHHAQAAQPGR